MKPRVRLGILPEINGDRMQQADRIPLHQDVKDQLKEANDGGYYFCFDSFF
ncbi:hypothetical protein NDK43_25845 [Neobacillus pocheonensis]|uniref:LLM class flavin-dependent oxidoreductase n=1 Tax=Neobacillus pocheonensis TaxID=363869 RepID=A0ABT0WFP7_9BACI|nr:hypothetical protein [Neobacillus pocheonensis]